MNCNNNILLLNYLSFVQFHFYVWWRNFFLMVTNKIPDCGSESGSVAKAEIALKRKSDRARLFIASVKL